MGQTVRPEYPANDTEGHPLPLPNAVVDYLGINADRVSSHTVQRLCRTVQAHRREIAVLAEREQSLRLLVIELAAGRIAAGSALEELARFDAGIHQL